MGLMNNIACNRGKEAPGWTCACPHCSPEFARKPMAADQLTSQRAWRQCRARKPMATQIRKPRRRMRATLGAERQTAIEFVMSPEGQRLMAAGMASIAKNWRSIALGGAIGYSLRRRA